MTLRHHQIVRICMALLAVLSTYQAFSQRPSPDPTQPHIAQNSPAVNCEVTSPSDKPTEYQREMLAVEQGKLKAQQIATIYTLMTIFVTAIIGCATVAYTVRNANLQASTQAALANSQANTQIQLAAQQAALQAKLKALEVVISAAGPKSAAERLEVVGRILGEKLIDPSMAKDFIARGVGPGHDQSRKDLIKMLLEYPEKQQEALRLWKIAFGKTNLEATIEAFEASLASRWAETSSRTTSSEGLPEPTTSGQDESRIDFL